MKTWCRYVTVISRDILRTPWELRWAQLYGPSVPPCFIKRREERKRKKEKFYIYLDVTHTHTRPEPGQPWKARGRKKRTQTTGKRPEQRRGGKGTNGPPEPTYDLRGETDLTKTEHTPKPHDTLRRSTGEELGTEWGLVGDGRETTKTSNLKRTQFQLQQKSCVTPLRDRSQVVPQWHKQLFKFQRIRCTICSTSPENHQKKKATPGKHVPACNVFRGHVSLQKLELQGKNKVSGSSDWLHTGRNAFRKIHWDGRTSGDIARRLVNGKANCFALLRWITRLKLSIL